ncbi:MAG: site-specific integrase [Actinobacteria bacterium]|nr:site-specific integrase [Actinomycetota bacterium]MCA1697509.1 site-specific integrase [Actinomycetota bacterium]
MSRLRRDPQVEALVAAYRADLEAAGQYAKKEVTSPARSFLLRVGVEGWSSMPLDEQLAIPGQDRRLVTWLIVTGRLRPTPEYLVASKLRVGQVAARVHGDFHRRFLAVAAELGFDQKSAELQWWAVARVAVLASTSPERVSKAQLDAGREKLITATRRLHPDNPIRTRPLTTRLHGAEATLFHAGVIDVPPRKRHPDKSADRAREWAAVPPRLRATLEGYIEQMRLSLRPATIVRVEAVLREFAGWLTAEAPEVSAVADLRRAHIERFKRHLAERSSVRGGRLSKIGLAEHLGTLRVCLERLSEWDGDDAPARVLMFAGDIPRRDEPLPRFIDDAAAAKLLRAAREDPDPFTRLAVEFLARTGLRKGEFLDLTVDSVVQIGSAYWLHVPLGKLRTDRYIPLHPQLKELLDRWVAERPAGLREPWLFIERGRRIGKQRVQDAVAKVAREAGIGRVTPHQLRHTLATQAINRGMSLEAIAALLGHRSMRMTMVYAKIANRTVAEEYFKVSEKVEALYDSPKELPATAEGVEMRKLRSEMHRRMLGNGYCARPVGLDCHFESICESCTYFQTTLEFRPTLQRQRDDAASKGQVGRQKIFDGLLTRLEQQAS